MNSDVKFIESNYDEDMLENGPYPVHLRKRISGTYGHLSNTKAVEFARSVSRQGDSVYFVHVSANCNSPDVLRRLEAIGAKVRMTSEEGSIVISRFGVG